MGFDLLQTIFGALFSGLVVDSWVFGIVCVLTYQYFRNFPEDKWGTKLLVLCLLGLQLFNAIIVAKMVYFYLVTSFGNYDALNNANWEFALFHGVGAIAEFLVQAYNARRIYILTKHRVAVTLILLLALASLGFGLAAMIRILIIVDMGRMETLYSVGLAWLTMSMGSDLIITIYQVIYLHRHRTGIEKTNRIINTLILYIMSTGLLTSISMFVEITTFAIMGWNYTHVFISVFLGGIYTMSFLANLDARRRVREIPGTGTFISFKFASTKSVGGISIEVQKTRQVLSDKFTGTHPYENRREFEHDIQLQHKSSTVSSNTVQSNHSEDQAIGDDVV